MPTAGCAVAPLGVQMLSEAMLPPRQGHGQQPLLLLRSLCLADNGLRAAGATALGRLLGQPGACGGLELLDLSLNDLGDDGCR